MRGFFDVVLVLSISNRVFSLCVFLGCSDWGFMICVAVVRSPLLVTPRSKQRLRRDNLI